jgi:hypothetical protein
MLPPILERAFINRPIIVLLGDHAILGKGGWDRAYCHSQNHSFGPSAFRLCQFPDPFAAIPKSYLSTLVVTSLQSAAARPVGGGRPFPSRASLLHLTG